nr:hypothetical protein [Moritella viscosa]SHO15734.1 Cytadherence high molecular weight protein 2-Cytadherence accessory protein 2 [Moritella viscosa]
MEFINAGLELGGLFLWLFVKLVTPLIIFLLLLGAMLFVTMFYITKLNNVYKEIQKSDCEFKLQEMKVGSELSPIEQKIQARANAITLESEVN